MMFPAHHLSSSKFVNGGFSGGGCDCFISLGRGFSDLMAEDEFRDETSAENEEDESNMKVVSNTNKLLMGTAATDDDHCRWLQLSLGRGHNDQSDTGHDQDQGQLTASVDLDLDLLPEAGDGSLLKRMQQPTAAPTAPTELVFQVPELRVLRQASSSFLWQPHHTTAVMNSVPFMSLQHHQQQRQQLQTNYNCLQLIRAPAPASMTTPPLNPPVSSSSSFSGTSEHHQPPLHLHRRLTVERVVNPPRRPHSGVWFILQASQNQAKEPFLPQIPKSYLRIKDGRMTVGLLVKYLVNKLELRSESEIEITCKGRQLLSLSTLQHVRDTIWNSPRNDVGFSVVPQSSASVNHLMVLNYGRIA